MEGRRLGEDDRNRLRLGILEESAPPGQQYDRHVRLARWTLPLWLYVSVTGVVIYLMLYQMDFGP